MCQRKIIGKNTFRIVPLLNGCECPQVKEIRDIDVHPMPQKRKKLNHCYDAHTTLPAGPQNMHVVFRNCVCKNPMGMCFALPPLLVIDPNYFPHDHDHDHEPDDDNDEPDEDPDWGIAGDGNFPVLRT